LARIQHAPLATQASAQAAVIALAPHNVDALGELGWDRFLMGAGSEGERLLREASALNPENINLKLQLAQGLVTARRFSDAAQILRALSNSNPNLLPALASVELLSSHAREAEETFRNFANLIPTGTPLRAFVEGQWQAIVQKKVPVIPAGISSPLAEGYACFLAGRFDQAVAFWRRVLEQSGGTDLRSRAMLAASLDRAGKAKASPGLPLLPFLPDFNDPYSPIAFNEMRRLLKMQ
jgi:cytochrome c-type biogenesis protein CcmH/NrfG